jgi:dTDP-4-dehydrorhamnose reductase
MRIAVTGSQGQIVRSLVERAAKRDAEIFTLARPSFDLADPSTILPAVESVAPDVIVNAAAYTAVDKAESEEALAQEINGVGAGSVAHAAKRLGIPIIQVSTDYVFDGTLDRPYREDDPTGPINAYGRSKLAGEQAVKLATPRHVILRTSWLYSPFGANFVRTMLRLAETRDKIGVVADQMGQPTCALDVADGVLAICDRLKAHPGEERLFGTFHMAAAGAASWADFAEAIFTETARLGRRRAAVARITTEQYPTPTHRPLNSRLDTQKLAEIYGVALPRWRNSLAAVIARLLERS